LRSINENDEVISKPDLKISLRKDGPLSKNYLIILIYGSQSVCVKGWPWKMRWMITKCFKNTEPLNYQCKYVSIQILLWCLRWSKESIDQNPTCYFSATRPTVTCRMILCNECYEGSFWQCNSLFSLNLEILHQANHLLAMLCMAI